MTRRCVRLRGAGIVLAAVALVLAAGCAGDEPYVFASHAYDPPRQAEPLLLQTATSTFDLSSYRGRVVAVVFGYTHCPDVCPLTLSNYAAARQLLEADEQSDLQVVMVTVDPERDTPAITGSYAAQFDPTFLGVSGSVEDVHAVLDAWGIMAEAEGTHEGHTVAHSAYSLVIDREGRRLLKVPYVITPETLAADLRAVLSD